MGVIWVYVCSKDEIVWEKNAKKWKNLMVQNCEKTDIFNADKVQNAIFFYLQGSLFFFFQKLNFITIF